LEGLVMAASQFWAGKRVFLTGHTGFKGSWLGLWLQHLGAEVTGYALDPPTDPSLFRKADIAACMHSVIADVRDVAILTSVMQSAQPEIVFHLAAQPLVRQSYADPIGTYEINVLGTIHLLEAVRKTPSVRAVVVVTTDKCYENKEWIWPYRETDPLGGFDPYSSSKACAEIVTSSWRDSFFNPAHYAEHKVAVASARAGNVIGGGDWASDRLIADIVRAFSSGHTALAACARAASRLPHARAKAPHRRRQVRIGLELRSSIHRCPPRGMDRSLSLREMGKRSPVEARRARARA
jgi:CDP-glucose 4,6-dehydratase